MVRHALEPQA